MKQATYVVSHNGTVAKRLREKLFPQLSELLELSMTIEDSQLRLLLQSSCLDIATMIEDFIEDNQGEHETLADILLAGKNIH